MNELNLNLPFIYGKEGEGFLFCKFPKVFFTDSRLKTMSSDAKLLYTFMVDRVALSITSNWRDEDGRVYIILTNEEACNLLNKSKKTISNAMNELGEGKFGLIERKKQGLGRADLIYVKNVDFLSKEGNEDENPVAQSEKTTQNGATPKGKKCKKTKENISEIHVENPHATTVENSCQGEYLPPQRDSISPSRGVDFTPPVVQNFPPIKNDRTNNEKKKNDLIRPTFPPSPTETFPQPTPREDSVWLEGWRDMDKSQKCDGLETEIEKAFAQGQDELASLLYHYRTDEEKMELALYVLMGMEEKDYLAQSFDEYTPENLGYRCRKLCARALLEMLTTTSLTKTKLGNISYTKVIDKLVPHIRQCKFTYNMEFDSVIDCVVKAYLEATKEVQVKYPLPYMKSCIWTTLLEDNVREETEFHYHFG